LAEIRSNPNNSDAKAALANLFGLEAAVLKEISERIITVMKDLTPEKRAGHRDALVENADSHAGDLSPRAMKIMVETAAGAATAGEKIHTGATDERMRDHNIQGVNPRMLGDVLRRSELTMNVQDDFLFGPNGILTNGDKPKPNVFHLAEERNKTDPSYIPFRNEVEKSDFPEFGNDTIRANERPTYAALNLEGMTRGAANLYGRCVFVLRPEVAQRATYTVDDTFKVVPLKITAKGIDALLKMLNEETPPPRKEISDTELADLKNPDSKYRQNVVDELKKLEGQEIMLKDIGPLDKDIGPLDPKDSKARVPVEFLVRAFGDSEAARRLTATYDTLENLLPQMGDVDAAGLAQAALNPRRKPGLSGHYIEAQVHGAFIPKRDIAEIRFNADYFHDVMNYGIVNIAKIVKGDPEKMTPEQIKLQEEANKKQEEVNKLREEANKKQKEVNQKTVQEHFKALRDFARDNGVKVVIFGYQHAIPEAAFKIYKAAGFKVVDQTAVMAEGGLIAQAQAEADNKAFTISYPSFRAVEAEAERVAADTEEFMGRLVSLGFVATGEGSGAALDRVKAGFLANVKAALALAREENAGLPKTEALIINCLKRAAEAEQARAAAQALGQDQ